MTTLDVTLGRVRASKAIGLARFGARVVDCNRAEPTAKAGAPKGNANAKKEGKRPLPGKDCIPAYGNRAEYLAGRIKAKAAEGDERAKSVADRITEYTSFTAKRRRT